MNSIVAHSIPPFGTTVVGIALGILQQGPGVDVTVGNPLSSVLGGAVGAFLSTLVVGAIMLAVAPDYTQRRMADVVEEPVGSFGYGLVSLVLLVLVTVILFVTIIGIIIAAPLALLTYVLWAVGSVVAFLAIADRIVDHRDGWAKTLLVGAGLNGLMALTGIGGLLSFCIGAAGFGAVLRAILD